jgi:uncharacterized repeat protein (TIGR01451 family)
VKTLWKNRVFSFVAVLTLILFAVARPVAAVHDDGLFELDFVTSPTAQGAANTVNDPSKAGDDWANVYAGNSGAFATAFITDPTGTAETSFFTGGGSKDERDIGGGAQHWEWDDTSDVIPDKDDISQAFAAAYAPTTGQDAGHTIFYFGADRFDTSGDAEIGFWFFRQPVTLGTKPNFNGVHEVGDILVLANWGGSNKVGDIAIYKWVGGNNPLQLLQDTTQADCSVAPANDAACAVINNTGGETPPWPYTNKDGQHSYQAAALFEGGIDLNDLLGVQDIGCFSSFLAETRSSHSTTAQLKDFALGAFPVCGIKVTKTGDTLSKIGDPVDYTITIENTGRATLYKRNISDTLLGAITTNGVDQTNSYVLTNNCGASLAPGATCTITLRRTVQPGDPDPLPNTVSILYSEHANFTGLEFTSSDDHSVNLFQPAVTIEKTGDGLSKVGDDVTYTFKITNASSQDSPNLSLASIDDNVIGSLLSQANAAGCDVLTYNEVCSFQVTRTVAAGDADPLVNTVDVLYHPEGFPNNITASDGHSVNLFQPSVSIEKTGNALSKIGDDVTYHFKITNTSSADSPNLLLNSISDDVLGDLASYATSCASLAPNATCEFDVPWTVAAVDLHPVDSQADDPVINTVTIHFHPDGFPNDITATGSHELNLFQPSIAFDKSADTDLLKVGDVVNYTLSLNNTSSPDSPDLVCTITDSMLGVSKQVTLASGTGDVTNVAYTVQGGDPDPLNNTASVQCSPTGFPNILSKSDTLSVNLFQPSVSIEKTGNALSKIGDDVTYHFTINNTSSADSPNLMLASIGDDVLGDLSIMATAAGCDNLAPGATCGFDVPWTVAQGSTDPVVNTVEVHYHPSGFPNDITDTDSHSLNLFQPSITFDKSADTQLSKVGDVVNYTLTLNNTSSADSPDLVCTVTDALLGVNKSVTLASGTGDATNVPYTVPSGAADPLVNNASVSCSPTGFPNVLTGSGNWSVNLFQPGIKVSKTGPAYTKQGDTASYHVTIENTSSNDAPDLVITKISDSLAGDLTLITGAASTCDDVSFRLASGASCTIDYNYLVANGAGATLTNNVTVESHPDQFPNAINGSASHDATLLHPTFAVTKACKAQPVPQAGPAVFTITFNNTGDADLHVVPSEGPPFDVAVGGSFNYDYSINGPFSATVNNIVTGKVTLAAKYGLSNSYDFTASSSCTVFGNANVVKTVNGAAPTGTQAFTFQLRQGASPTQSGNTLETLAANAANGGVLNFTTNLVPGQTYQMCEIVMPGWLTSLGTFVPDSFIPPDGVAVNPNVDNSILCANFAPTSGSTTTFTVDNTPPPGGRALTIGFWKNWASCANSKGGQKPVLDQTLAAAEPTGIVVSATSGSYPAFGATFYLVLHDTNPNPDVATDCLKAVRLLNKSTTDTGKKMASDPAFNLAAQLVAAELNYTAGAGKTPAATTAINQAVLLLGKYKFDGKTHTAISAADAATMNNLATILDNYNNNRP